LHKEREIYETSISNFVLVISGHMATLDLVAAIQFRSLSSLA
jgi:hypothetical protein